MGNFRFGANRAWILALLATIPASPAHAYLDPGTGSYLFQLLVGMALGSLMAVKIYWRRIVETLHSLHDTVRRLVGRKKPSEERDG